MEVISANANSTWICCRNAAGALVLHWVLLDAEHLSSQQVVCIGCPVIGARHEFAGGTWHHLLVNVLQNNQFRETFHPKSSHPGLSHILHFSLMKLYTFCFLLGLCTNLTAMVYNFMSC